MFGAMLDTIMLFAWFVFCAMLECRLRCKSRFFDLSFRGRRFANRGD